MERFVKGDLVVVAFPFSDLSATKRRPALVLAYSGNRYYILCQITSKTVKDEYAIVLDEQEIVEGKLIKSSNIRPNRIFTAEDSIIQYRVGKISPIIINKVIDKLIAILRL
jgi:mRNA interferase MazF